MSTINFSDGGAPETIDSRDIIKRLEELQEKRDDLLNAAAEADEEFQALDDDEAEGIKAEYLHTFETAEIALKEWDDENKEELDELNNIDSDCRNYCPDWRHGEQLISEEYFTTYAEELANDIGAVDSSASWPLNCIDWDEAASLLKQDYSSTEFYGTTYYFRG